MSRINPQNVRQHGNVVTFDYGAFIFPNEMAAAFYLKLRDENATDAAIYARRRATYASTSAAPIGPRLSTIHR